MRLIQHSLSAGEFAPELYGRADLDKYDLGARELYNMVINYGGGANKRRGMRFGEFLQHPESPIRFFGFKFSADLANTYLVIFGDGYIRFAKDGAYVLEDEVEVTSVTDGVVAATAHGYSDGDLVYLASRYELLEVANKTDDTFEVKNIFGETLSFTDGLTAAQRVFTLANPFATADFYDIESYQVFDVVKFTHPDYAPQLLTRTDDSWTIGVEDRSNGAPLAQTPGITHSGAYIRYIKITAHGAGYNEATEITLTGGGGSDFEGDVVTYDVSDPGDAISGVTIINAGTGYTSAPSVSFSDNGGETDATAEAIIAPLTAGFIIAVSAVYDDGTESGITRPGIIRASIDFTQTRGSATYSWAAVTGAVSYNIYRSLIVPDGADIHLGYPMGYIGNSRGTNFTDDNITPDFTRTPRIFRNPFASGAITAIKVTAAGTGYSANDTITMSGDGELFAGYPIVQNNEIIGVYIAHPGQGYVDPAITVGTAGGSGATFEITTSAESGNNPAVAFRFQQREGYAGTHNNPMTVYAAQVNDLNFSLPEVVAADDPYTYTIDAQEVAPIKHALPVQSGLLLFTASNVALLRAADGLAVTPSNGFLDPVTFVGASNLQPQLVLDDIVYIQHKNRGLQMLTARSNSNTSRYSGAEISILARHLFTGQDIKALAFTYASEKRGYGIYANGRAFTVTLANDQQLYAFSRASTRGYLRDAVAIDVGSEEHLYFQTERYLNGQWVKAFELVKPEASAEPEDAVYLDAAVFVEKVTPAATVTASGTTGEITVTASAPVFVVGDVGSVFGMGGGRGIVTAHHTGMRVTVTLTRDITALAPESTEPAVAEAGEWWLNPPITTVSNIPFEGATVQVVADGKRMADKVVVDGSITLDYPAAIVVIGFGYEAWLTTLPITATQEIIEGKSQNIRASSIYFSRTGPCQANGYDLPIRTNEAWNEPARFFTGRKPVTITSGWGPDGSLTLTASVGLPMEVIQIVHDADIGD